MIQLKILNKHIDFTKDGIIEREDAIKAMNEYAEIYHQAKLKLLNIDDVSPVNIEIKDWDYTCGDGCCYEYGETISVNGKECDNHHAGGSVKQSLEYTLTELKIPFNINEG